MDFGLEGVGGVDFSGVGVDEGFSVLEGEDFAGVEG